MYTMGVSRSSALWSPPLQALNSLLISSKAGCRAPVRNYTTAEEGIGLSSSLARRSYTESLLLIERLEIKAFIR